MRRYLEQLYDKLTDIEGNPLQSEIPEHILNQINTLANDLGEHLDTLDRIDDESRK